MSNITINKSKSFKDEYCATCVRIGEITPIEGRDRIVKTMVNGLSIVIGKDEFKTGDVAVYCANESVINKTFLYINSMYDDSSLNIDNTKKGYINKHGRIRIVKLGGVPSYGLLLNPESLAVFLNISKEEVIKFLESHVGEDFDEINGEKFIQVYVPPVRNSSQSMSKSDRRQKKLDRFKMLIEGTFKFHYDTEGLQKHMNEINQDDEVYISCKLHGCVEENTIINTLEYGDLTIKEIVDKKLDCKIKAYDVETNEITYVSIDDYYLLKNDGEWYEIELEDGRKIHITGNNPVWLPELNCYRRTDQLKVGDELLID